MSKKFVIIDGNSLIFRAFHALPPMSKRDGTPVNAVYGFFTMLFTMVDTYAPDYLAVAFDLKGPTFRVQMYDAYKGTRAKTPDDLHVQIPLIKEALQTLGIKTLEKETYEADDIIGTLTAQSDEQKLASLIFTGDKDALQLVSEYTNVLLTKKGVSETEVFDLAHMEEVYGLTPKQFIDLKGLMGDNSDNIPGIAGVGEKTALKLLHQFGSIESLYANVEELPQNKMKEKIIAGEESAFLSKELATIERNVPIDCDLESLAFAGKFDEALLYSVLQSFEFHSLINRRGLAEDKREDIAVTLHIVSDEVLLAQLLKEIQVTKIAAICMEENHLYIAADALTEYQFAIEVSLFDDRFQIKTALEAIVPVLQSLPSLIIHDEKAFMHFIDEYDQHLDAPVFDTMLGEYVLDPTQRDFSLEKLRNRYEGTGHATALFGAMAAQKADIEKSELQTILYDIELPLCKVLFDMEKEGFRIDIDLLKVFAQDYGEKIALLTSEIHEMADDADFNIASTKQLGVILFEKLELPVVKKTKTGYSTDAEVLEKLQGQHPIIDKIMEYRLLTKIKSTYLDGLLKVADPKTSKVHTTFSQTATATGRISSIEPNLQNIPIRSEFTSQIRSLFIPSVEENYIVAADYSQIELRVLAHITEDSHMIDAFTKGEDIHTRTASEVFDVPQSEVTAEMRSSAKAVNFGIVYGISDFGLSRNLGIPRYKAEEYISRYLHEFEGVQKYMHDIVAQAKEDGFVRTLYGRIRYVNELKASNYNRRSFGERVALNTPIQGAAADIIKIAMNRVASALKTNNMRSKLISQVHDELIVDAVPGEVDAVSELLKQTMENVIELRVPLVANVAVGKTWSEAK